MRPELFTLFGVVFPSYFALLTTGFLFAIAVGVLWARRIGEDPDVIVDLGLAMILAGLVGGRFMHVVFDGHLADYVHMCTDPRKVSWPLDARTCVSAEYGGVWDTARLECHPGRRDCFAWAKFWAGGLTYYGGFLAAVPAAYFVLARDRFPFWKAADMAGFAIPLGLAFGRIGCWLAGCCFGTFCSLPWAAVFPAHSPASEAHFRAHSLASNALPSLPVHPTQLYEALLALAISACALLVWHPKKRYDGQVFVQFTAFYAVGRFALEFFRNDERGGLWGLSTSQWVGLLMLAFAFGVHRLKLHKSRRIAGVAAY